MPKHTHIRNVLCIGAGFVGGPTMAVMADQCPDLRFTVVDVDSDKIDQWNSASLPIFEPGLNDVVTRTRGRNLFFAPASKEAIAQADIIFVSVNTPTKQYGEGAGKAADLQYWERCARDILASARDGTIVVEKSTVPVRTADTISRILHASQDGRKFFVLSNPEFLAEGTAIADLQKPDRVLIGWEAKPGGKQAARALAEIYRHWVPRKRIIFSNVWSSELSKLAANAMLAQRVSSINSISALCEVTEADIGEISRAIGMDKRIGDRFLEAGVGFGGSCFRKDILNLAYLCGHYGLHEVAAYWQQVVDINDYQISRFARQVVERQFNSVAGKKIAVFGFAFKPGTNDTRDAPAIQICKFLLEEQAALTITDPQALDNARKDLAGIDGDIRYESDPYLAAKDAHAIVLLTHWPKFANLDYQRIYQSMNKPAFVFDGRRLLDSRKLFKMGFSVYTIGSQPMSNI